MVGMMAGGGPVGGGGNPGGGTVMGNPTTTEDKLITPETTPGTKIRWSVTYWAGG